MDAAPSDTERTREGEMKGDNGQEERRFGREDRGPMGRRRESWIFESGNGDRSSARPRPK